MEAEIAGEVYFTFAFLIMQITSNFFFLVKLISFTSAAKQNVTKTRKN